MTEIQLTDDQRQALQTEPGKPVDVVDPATQRRYVLLARELYERVRSLLEGGPAPATVAAPVGSPPPEGRALRVRVRDLPMPPEVAEALRERCQRYWIRRRREVLEEEDQLKLQHYYGGRWIAYLRTEAGPVVVAASDGLDPTFDQQLSCLTPEERRQRLIDCPVRLFDTESEILTPFADDS